MRVTTTGGSYQGGPGNFPAYPYLVDSDGVFRTNGSTTAQVAIGVLDADAIVHVYIICTWNAIRQKSPYVSCITTGNGQNFQGTTYVSSEEGRLYGRGCRNLDGVLQTVADANRNLIVLCV